MDNEKNVTKDDVDKYHFSVEIIESGHKKLMKIIGDAVKARQHNNDPEEIADVLYEMTQYALNHFKAEEKYMQKYEYAEYELHKKEHKGFMLKIVDYCNRTMKRDYDITDELLEYLSQWLINHIKRSDKKFAEAIKLKVSPVSDVKSAENMRNNVNVFITNVDD